MEQATTQAFNDKGSLLDYDTWDRDFAIEMARDHGLELTDCHWLIIDFLRDYYAQYEIAPDPREIIKKLSKQINPVTPCTRKHLEGLFGEGGCKLACKIAGLPDCHCRPI